MPNAKHLAVCPSPKPSQVKCFIPIVQRAANAKQAKTKTVTDCLLACVLGVKYSKEKSKIKEVLDPPTFSPNPHRVNFPKHWLLLCHAGIYLFEFEFEFTYKEREPRT
jgi:hypothetical protein